MSRTERGRPETVAIQVEAQDQQRFLDVVSDFLQRFGSAFHSQFGAGGRDKYAKSTKQVVEAENKFLKNLRNALFASNQQTVVANFRERIRGNYGKLDTLLMANGLGTSAEALPEFQTFVEAWATQLERAVAALSENAAGETDSTWEHASWNMTEAEVLAQFRIEEVDEEDEETEEPDFGEMVENDSVIEAREVVETQPEVPVTAMSISELLLNAEAYGQGAADALSELLRAVAAGDPEEVSAALQLFREVVDPAAEEDSPEAATDKSLEDEAFEMLAENDRLRVALTQAQREVERANAAIEAGRAEYTRVSAANTQLEQERGIYVPELQRLREQLAELQARLKSAERAMTTEASTVRTLQEHTAALTEQNATAIAAREAAVAEQTRLQQEVANLQRQLAELIAFTQRAQEEEETDSKAAEAVEESVQLQHEIAQLRDLREVMRDALERERAPALPFDRRREQIRILETQLDVYERLLELRTGSHMDGLLAISTRVQEVFDEVSEIAATFEEILEQLRSADAVLNPEELEEALEEATDGLVERLEGLTEELDVLAQLMSDVTTDIEDSPEFVPRPIHAFSIEGLPFTIENTEDDTEFMQLGRDVEALFARLTGRREHEIIRELGLRDSGFNETDMQDCAKMVRDGFFMERTKLAFATLNVARRASSPEATAGRGYKSLQRALDVAGICVSEQQSRNTIKTLQYFRSIAEHISALDDIKLLERKVVPTTGAKFALNALTREGRIVANMWLHDIVQSGQASVEQFKSVFRNVNTQRRKKRT